LTAHIGNSLRGKCTAAIGYFSTNLISLLRAIDFHAAGIAIYAGHSLRAGLATSAAIAGASERSIMNQTGHRSSAMVRRYIRNESLLRENAAAKVGL